MFDLQAAEANQPSWDAEAETASFSSDNGDKASALLVTRVEAFDLIIASKSRGGFRAADVQALRRLVAEIASGVAGACKFLVLDFAHGSPSGLEEVPAGFDELLDEAANLIMEVPVLSVAWARGPVSGTDLEVALTCSMLVGEERARFSFATDLVDRFRSYAILAHKIGFAKAERLMEGGETIDVEEMLRLCLLKAAVPAVSGRDAIERFVQARARRHNSSCGIYRAQRIAMGPL